MTTKRTIVAGINDLWVRRVPRREGLGGQRGEALSVGNRLGREGREVDRKAGERVDSVVVPQHVEGGLSAEWGTRTGSDCAVGGGEDGSGAGGMSDG